MNDEVREYMDAPFLLCRSVVMPGESLNSYLIRLSFLNEYSLNTVKNIYLARKTWKDVSLLPIDPRSYDVLSQLIQISPYEIYKTTKHYFARAITPEEDTLETIRLSSGEDVPILTGHTWRKHFRSYKDVPYCPHCLQENLYYRQEWRLRMISICRKHQTLLARYCPECKRRADIARATNRTHQLRVEDIMKGECPQCGFDLTKTRVRSVAKRKHALWTQDIMAYCLGIMNKPPVSSSYTIPIDTVPIESPSILYQVITILYAPQSSWKEGMEPALAYSQALAPFEILVNWPQGFHKYLDSYRTDNGQWPSTSLVNTFDPFYSDTLERLWHVPHIWFIQEAFNFYIAENFMLDPLILNSRRYKASPALMKKFPFVTIADAARQLSTTPKIIHRLVLRGELIPYKLTVRREGKYWEKKKKPHQHRYVRRDEIEVLRERWQAAVPLADVVNILGVYKTVVLDLHEIGLLTAVRGRRVDGFNSWFFSFESVERLLMDIEKSVLFYTGARAVGIKSATQMFSPYGYNMAKLLKMLLDGELRCYWGWEEGLNIADLLVSVYWIEEQIGLLREARESVPRQYIAERMGVKPYIVWRWAVNGLIGQEDQRVDGAYFIRDDADAFINGHVFSDTVAELLQVGPLTVQHWARNGRLEPVSGPNVDNCHRYLFRLEDVNKLLPENRLTAPQLAAELGISRSRIGAWIKQGKVKPISGPSVDKMKHYLFVRDDELEAVIKNYTASKGKSEEE